jgi:adenylate kinase family enzyme
MIIGGPGSGKSWLADALARRLNLPVIAIDDLLHDEGGRLRDGASIDADARQAALGENWIIEGGNTRTYADRASRADCVIRLRPPRAVRLCGVLRRGRVSWPLLWWTWRYDRDFELRDDAVLASVDGALAFDLRSAKAVAAFLADFPCPSGRAPSPLSMGQNSV